MDSTLAEKETNAGESENEEGNKQRRRSIGRRLNAKLRKSSLRSTFMHNSDASREIRLCTGDTGGRAYPMER